MIEKEEILNDLESVSKKIDTVPIPDKYSELGEYDPERVIELFGSWDEALKLLGFSKKDRIRADMKSKSENNNLTASEYRDKGVFSIHEVGKNFGSWAKAKEDVGLNTNRGPPRITIEDIKEDVKRVNEKISKTVTLKEYKKHGKYSVGVFQTRDITFSEIREELGIEAPEGIQPKKKALEAWKERLKLVRGKFRPSELKSLLDETGFIYYPSNKRYLSKALEEANIVFEESSGSGGGKKYFINGPESGSMGEYYKEYIEKIPSDKKDWFFEILDEGHSPKTVVAAIRYITEDKTQREIAKEEDVTEVSIRDAMKKIVQEFNISEDEIVSNED